MLLSHHDPEASTARFERIETLKVHYRSGIIGDDAFVLSLTLLGMTERDAKSEAAMIRVDRT